jgi:hypothetical protein
VIFGGRKKAAELKEMAARLALREHEINGLKSINEKLDVGTVRAGQELGRLRAELTRITPQFEEIEVVRERERSAAETASKCRQESEALGRENRRLRSDLAEAKKGQAMLSASTADAIRKAKESALKENIELRNVIGQKQAEAFEAGRHEERRQAGIKLGRIKCEWEQIRDARRRIRESGDVLDGLLDYSEDKEDT